VPGQPWPPAPGAPQFGGYAPPKAPAIDFAKINPMAYLVVGGGLLALIFSMVPYYTATVSVNFLGIQDSESVNGNAWNGFFGWFGVLLLLAAAALVALKELKVFEHAMVPMFTLIASGVGLICIFLSLFVDPISTASIGGGYSSTDLQAMGITVSYGHNIGFWVCLIAALASVAGAVMLFMAAQNAAKPAVYPPAGYPPAGFPPMQQPQQWPMQQPPIQEPPIQEPPQQWPPAAPPAV